MKTKQRFLQKKFIPSKEICVTYKYEKTIYRMHYHNFYELDIITDGSGISNLNGKDINFRKNTAFFLSPKDFHDIVPETALHITNLQISNDTMKRCFPNCSSMKGSYSFFDDDTAKDVNEICTLLTKENRKSDYLNSLLTALIRLLFSQPESPVTPDSGKNIMRSVINYVNEHYRENPSLETLSKLFDRTPNYISSRFTAITGENYKTYLKQLKLDAALKLLVSTELSVTDVCYESGYETISHFNREFKNYFGRSPKQVRKSPDHYGDITPRGSADE